MPDTIRVEEQYAKRTGQRSGTGEVSYSRVYKVISSAVLSEPEVLAAIDTTTQVAIPKPLDKHPNDSLTWVTAVSAAVAEENNHIWEVTVTYERPKGGGPPDPEDEDEDPCNARPVVKFGSAPYTKIIEVAYWLDEPDPDTQGTPTLAVRNSAGDPFDPPVQEELTRPVISVEYNVRRFSPNLKIKLEGTINLDPITVAGMEIPAKKGRITQLECNPLYDTEDELYWQMQVTIELNMDGFTRRILDQGFYYLDGDDKKEITALDKDGQAVPVTESQKLDGEGGLSADPVYLDFETKWPASWAPLNLPRSY